MIPRRLRAVAAAGLAGAVFFALVPSPRAGGDSHAVRSDVRPHALQLLLNGKKMAIEPVIGGPDNYNDFHGRNMTVEARWKGNARKSGYFIRISTTEPQQKVYATCFAGTRCTVPGQVPVLLNQEVSWQVEIVTTTLHATLAGYKYCLVGR